MIRVLLVDDHQLVRAGVTTLLQSDPEITVVGEARNGREAVESVEGIDPDVVLMDLSMPEMDGVEATRAVLALAAGHQGARADQLLGPPAGQGGARRRGDRLRAQGLRARRPARRGARRRPGHVPIDPRVAAALLPATGGAGGAGAADGLSPRETEVLRLVAQGLANKQIARALGITERTVKAHLGPGVPRDRGARPHQRGPVGPRQPARRLTASSSAGDTHGARPTRVSPPLDTASGCRGRAVSRGWPRLAP